MSEQEDATNAQAKMNIFPTAPEIKDDEGFSQNDLFGFAEFGETLANLFLGAKDLSVALLDDGWGMGKTTFVKQWAGLMRAKACKVIYVDAFENDFYQDPFLMVTSEILSHKDLADDNTRIDLIDKAANLGVALSGNLTEIVSGEILKSENIKEFLTRQKSDTERDKQQLKDFNQDQIYS